MKSVLFISIMNGAAWGGSEEIWYQSALWLAKHQYPVGICCFNWPEKQNKLQQLEKERCKLYLLPGKYEARSIWGKLKLNKALKVVPFADYEIVVVNQGGWKDVAYRPFKNLYTRLPRYVLTFHNYNTSGKLGTGKINSLRKWVNNATVNLAGAGKIFTVLNEAYSLKIPNQHLLYNPITFTPPAEITYYPSPDNKVFLAMLATFDIERKAQDILIRTLAGSKWKDRNWELNLYGRGKDELLLKTLISELDLESKVFLRGHTDNVMQVLTKSHLLLQITRIDAMPISVVEAMALSRPVIISEIGDMPLWVEPSVNGWMCQELNSEAIDAVLEEAWMQQAKWAEMGKESFRIFRQKYPADPVKHFLQTTGILIR